MSPPAIPPDVLPPVDPRSALRLAAVGAALCALAAALDLVPFDEDGGPAALATARLFLVAIGALTVGAAVSLRPDLWGLWLAAAGTAAIASVGIPEPRARDWDSARMLARVMAGAAAAGAALVALPATARSLVLSAFALFHFGAILTATTWPETGGTAPPWVTTQAAARVYIPYFRFLYLSNAYHFYSPEPGPASHLFVLLASELTSPTRPTADPESWTPRANPATGAAEWWKASYEWVDVPNRRQHYKDPLGLTYYRRLSLTEMVSPAMPSRFTAVTYERSEAVVRRRLAAVGTDEQPPIPLDVRAGPPDLQYRIPRSDVTRYLLPSYARHLADEFSGPSRTAAGEPILRAVKSVKIYRVEHTVTPAEQFVGRRLPYPERPREAPLSPYHPITYKPYFVGEYDAAGTLRDPMDPMLYWLCPILPKAVGPSDPLKRDFEDYMSKHAGFEFDWERRVGQ